MEVVGIVIGGAALCFAVMQGIASYRRSKQEDRTKGTAELIAEIVDVDSDELRVRVLVRNKGVATAYGPYVFLVESGVPTLAEQSSPDSLAMGQAEWLFAGLEVPAAGSVEVWLGWDDVRGFHERDTGHRV